MYIIFNLATDLVNKVEATEALETLKISSTKTNIFRKVPKNLPLKTQLMRLKLLSKLNQLNQSLNNPKLLPLSNTTRVKELKSIILMKRKPQPKKEKLVLNGSKKKS